MQIPDALQDLRLGLLCRSRQWSCCVNRDELITAWRVVLRIGR